MEDFSRWFEQLSGGLEPHAWQQTLAQESDARTRLIRVPTGMGKTLGVLAAWSYHRLARNDPKWPRRLVWCLPMRVLVEQTKETVEAALRRLDLLWDPALPHEGKVGVHLLMGGADEGGDWTIHPEADAVLIGTQDMLLSRALNRGYASGRARWPLEFALVSHDALWVMDEVQLMDVGLATSAQLQAFHDDDQTKAFRPRRSWWMSATLQPTWLESVDTRAYFAGWSEKPLVIPPGASELVAGRKTLFCDTIPFKDASAFAKKVSEVHEHNDDGPHGRITLVICNTVDRAVATFDALNALRNDTEIELVHSRFRPVERKHWIDRFLSKESCRQGSDRLIVSTQVVEAGVDISAGALVTELAPWTSLVQRFGRCARYGGAGKVIVVDRGGEERDVLPYTAEELQSAREALDRIGEKGDVGLAALERFEASLSEEERARLYPYEPRHLIIRQEFEELFDTTPDLTGADIDVSRFIRSGDERDLQVFWLDLPLTEHPSNKRKARRDELCPVPFLRARDWLCGDGKAEMLAPGKRAWVWDFLEGR